MKIHTLSIQIMCVLLSYSLNQYIKSLYKRGAFIVVRTLSRVRVPSYCTAAPLDCGDPLGYFDYDMIQQLVLNGLESVALFGGAAVAMEYAYSKKWISKFPN